MTQHNTRARPGAAERPRAAAREALAEAGHGRDPHGPASQIMIMMIMIMIMIIIMITHTTTTTTNNNNSN